MTARTFVYETLKNDPDLQTLVSSRVFQGESLLSSEQVKPFLVYRMGNDTSEGLSEVDTSAHRQFFQVYCHTAPADYYPTDEMCRLVIEAFRKVLPAGVERIYTVIYLETSRDLDDLVLGTIYRYVRFQLVMN